MKRAGVVCLASALACGALGESTSSAQGTGVANLTGVWRAQMDSLPAVTLTDESGSLSDLYTSTPRLPEPIFHPVFDGQTLTFEVSHRRAHPPRTLSDPPVTFRLKLTRGNTAGLSRGELNQRHRAPSGTSDDQIRILADWQLV